MTLRIPKDSQGENTVGRSGISNLPTVWAEWPRRWPRRRRTVKRNFKTNTANKYGFSRLAATTQLICLELYATRLIGSMLYATRLIGSRLYARRLIGLKVGRSTAAGMVVRGYEPTPPSTQSLMVDTKQSAVDPHPQVCGAMATNFFFTAVSIRKKTTDGARGQLRLEAD